MTSCFLPKRVKRPPSSNKTTEMLERGKPYLLRGSCCSNCTRNVACGMSSCNTVGGITYSAKVERGKEQDINYIQVANRNLFQVPMWKSITEGGFMSPSHGCQPGSAFRPREYKSIFTSMASYHWTLSPSFRPRATTQQVSICKGVQLWHVERDINQEEKLLW